MLWTKGLVERMKETYVDTRIRAKIGKQKGDEFWTGMELRQGCPLSTLLLSLMYQDLEEMLERKGKGGILLGNSKLFLFSRLSIFWS